MALIDDLKCVYSEGQGGRGTLDFLRIVTEPSQTAAEYRRMLSEVQTRISGVLAAALCGRSAG